MPETNQMRIGDRVTMEGNDSVFFVIEMNHETQTASLLPSGEGKILSKIAWESLKFYRGLEV
jgi:hypothetical protein